LFLKISQLNFKRLALVENPTELDKNWQASWVGLKVAALQKSSRLVVVPVRIFSVGIETKSSGY
jgi:hypothetical protein